MFIKYTSSGLEDHSMYAGAKIKLQTNEGTTNISIRQGEPEDAMFGRDLPSPSSLFDMLKQAYQAGLDGEELTIEEEHD